MRVTARMDEDIKAEFESICMRLPNFEEDRVAAHAAVANGTAKLYKNAAELFADLDAEGADEPILFPLWARSAPVSKKAERCGDTR